MEKVIEIARGELGQTEEPPGSNLTKYGEAYAWNGVPWCVIFLWWCFREAGESAAFFGGRKTASCGTLYRWYAERGQGVPAEDIRPGDIVLLNFSGTGETQHCGLVERVVDRSAGWYRTIEGNTSPGLEGSQASGGAVALKARNRKNILGACRPAYAREERPDYAGHWAEAAMDWGIRRGLLRGYDDGTWQPDREVTRGELMTILQRLEEGRA